MNSIATSTPTPKLSQPRTDPGVAHQGTDQTQDQGDHQRHQNRHGEEGSQVVAEQVPSADEQGVSAEGGRDYGRDQPRHLAAGTLPPQVDDQHDRQHQQDRRTRSQ
jgi:hypothetical protein